MKFLHALESITSETVVSDEVEMDEKYLLNSDKSEKHQIAGFPVNRYVCLPECRDKEIQFSRQRTWQLRNWKISRKFRRIFLGTALTWIDGKTAYQRILNQKNCEFRAAGDHKPYIYLCRPSLMNGIADTEERQESISTQHAALLATVLNMQDWLLMKCCLRSELYSAMSRTSSESVI